MLVVTAVQSSQASAATAPGSAEQVVTLDLKPRNAALLQLLAARSSGRAPLSSERLAELFYPSEAQVATVRTAMAAQGFRLIARHGLALRFAGAPAAAKRAFGESQAVGQSPASLTGLVSDVEGLEGTPPLKPQAVAGPRTVTPSCSGAQDLHDTAGGYLPAQLASPAGYEHDALINAGYDGDGESIAFVEFSNYLPSDIAAYKSCFGLSVPITDVPVAGGNAQRSSALEVSLDVETAISAAPGLDHAYVYIAPPTASMASVLDQIVAEQPSTGVHVISVSWGLCETLMTPSRVAATNTARQLAAVAGISVLVGSGDQGSLDCGLPPLSVDDPAAQPFATAVGGTSLFLDRAGPPREVVWNDLFGAGGGGISRFWAKPTWQTGPGVINSYSSGVPCHRSAGVCREVPDVSLNATAGRRGYIVHCTAGDCFHQGWMLSGGTSASAPLMAGIVADANQYSRAHGGQRLGFANPFLYQTFQDTGSVFRDITLGDNSLGFDGRYPATAGYDLATGIGSVGAQGLATALAASSPSAPTLRPTTLTAAPAGPRIALYGTPITFRGQLRGPSGPLAGQVVYLQGTDQLGFRQWRTTTGADGTWSVTLGREITRKFQWRAVYLGSQRRSPSSAPGSVVHVIPSLGIGAALPVVHGRQTGRAGVPFRMTTSSTPRLIGRTVVVWARPLGAVRWTKLGPAATGALGRASRSVVLPRPGLWQMRWRFSGGLNGQWMSTASPVITVAMTV